MVVVIQLAIALGAVSGALCSIWPAIRQRSRPAPFCFCSLPRIQIGLGDSMAVVTGRAPLASILDGFSMQAPKRRFRLLRSTRMDRPFTNSFDFRRQSLPARLVLRPRVISEPEFLPRRSLLPAVFRQSTSFPAASGRSDLRPIMQTYPSLCRKDKPCGLCRNL